MMSPGQNKNNQQLLQSVIKTNLNKKYLTSRDYYNGKVVTDIIYNECTNVVSVFKDYLILDDVSEFLKRPYNKQECIERLPKVIDFYEKYSKVFPNYINLPESKFMFKNIERKQRHIDEKQRAIGKIQKDNDDKSKKKRGYKNPDGYSIDMFNRNKLFGPSFFHSMARLDEESRIYKQTQEIPKKFEEIVMKFCDLDSETSKVLGASNISIDISLSNANDESFINKFKKNKIMPDFNDSLSTRNSPTEKSKPIVNKKLDLFKSKFKKVHNYMPKGFKFNELEIKEKFTKLKDNFNRSSSRK